MVGRPRRLPPYPRARRGQGRGPDGGCAGRNCSAMYQRRARDRQIRARSAGRATNQTHQDQEGGHRSPMGEAGAAAAGEIVDMALDSREDDLVLCTFTAEPARLPALHPKSAGRYAAAHGLYAAGCGATIHEINTLRKHLSRFSGGSLARPSRPPCSRSSYPTWWATTLTSSPPAPPCPIRAPSPIACG